MTRDEIGTVIGSVLDEILPPVACGPSHGATLFGPDGVLDSVGLLSLVVLLEERVQEATGKPIRLVSASALSAKHSPFRTAESLTDYVAGLLCP